MNEKLDYFMSRTDQRLSGIEKKIEQLISFRMMLYGGAAVISTIISLAIAIYFGK